MEHLPPVGWADVATKRDLDALESRVALRFDRFDERFGDVDRRFEVMDRRFDELRSLLISVMSIMAVLFAAMTGAIVAAIKV